MKTMTTQTGDRLYVGSQLAFLARQFYCDAWGTYKVAGTLFSLEDGQMQRDAVATCNLPTSEADIVHHALRKAGDA